MAKTISVVKHLNNNNNKQKEEEWKMFVQDFDLSWVWPPLYRAKPKRDLAKKLSSIVMYGVWYVLLQRSVVSCTGDLLVETFLKSENKSKSYLEVRIILANNATQISRWY